MGCYGYGDSVSQRVLIGAHVKFSDYRRLGECKWTAGYVLHIESRANTKIYSPGLIFVTFKNYHKVNSVKPWWGLTGDSQVNLDGI